MCSAARLRSSSGAMGNIDLQDVATLTISSSSSATDQVLVGLEAISRALPDHPSIDAVQRLITDHGLPVRRYRKTVATTHAALIAWVHGGAIGGRMPL